MEKNLGALLPPEISVAVVTVQNKPRNGCWPGTKRHCRCSLLFGCSGNGGGWRRELEKVINYRSHRLPEEIIWKLDLRKVCFRVGLWWATPNSASFAISLRTGDDYSALRLWATKECDTLDCLSACGLECGHMCSLTPTPVTRAPMIEKGPVWAKADRALVQTASARSSTTPKGGPEKKEVVVVFMCSSRGDSCVLKCNKKTRSKIWNISWKSLRVSQIPLNSPIWRDWTATGLSFGSRPEPSSVFVQWPESLVLQTSKRKAMEMWELRMAQTCKCIVRRT